MPITLDVAENFAQSLQPGTSKIALRDPEGVMLALLHVEDVWKPDRKAEAESVFGTTSPAHPGVDYLLHQAQPWYVGGRLEGTHMPSHYDFRSLRLTPAELRAELTRLGWRRVVAFQTRNPMHRAHVELTFRAAKQVGASLLIHPSVGMTKPGDVDYFTRVRCYQLLLPKFPTGTVKLSLLPLAMRMGGPREAIWHALIRKNHGATHMIVGRDHAGPGKDSNGKPFYGPYQAQELFKKNEAAVGVTMVPFNMMVYLEDQGYYVPDNEVPNGSRVLNISGTELRQRLNEGREIPGWFTYPEVVEELRRSFPPRHRQGLTIFFTGLSGSGKSTIANVLVTKFLEAGGRPVTLLDGDLVRKHLSSELGFSKEHRDINIRRIGYVAAEITKNGGIAICAPIAPYDSVRKQVRAMIEPVGGFILVHIATPLEICEQRDRKGLYAKARAGIIPEFTGISDPYEEPKDAQVVINTADLTPEEAVQEILLYLEREGFIGVNGSHG
jgi:sulfate adenylyltransferase